MSAAIASVMLNADRPFVELVTTVTLEMSNGKRFRYGQSANMNLG